jgi:hypothetical protein
MVSVVYGSKNGLRTGASGNPQLFYENVAAVGVTVNSFWGSGLAAADFGRSGNADLAVGAVGRDGDEQNAGAVGVIYGSATGLVPGSGQFISQDVPGVEDTGDEGDFFGRALAGGRFDGRGAADLAIGIPLESILLPEALRRRGGGPMPIDVGAVALFRGTNEGITLDGDRLLYQGAGGLRGTPEEFDFFGVALSGPGSGPTFD